MVDRSREKYLSSIATYESQLQKNKAEFESYQKEYASLTPQEQAQRGRQYRRKAKSYGYQVENLQDRLSKARQKLKVAKRVEATGERFSQAQKSISKKGRDQRIKDLSPEARERYLNTRERATAKNILARQKTLLRDSPERIQLARDVLAERPDVNVVTARSRQELASARGREQAGVLQAGREERRENDYIQAQRDRNVAMTVSLRRRYGEPSGLPTAQEVVSPVTETTEAPQKQTLFGSQPRRITRGIEFAKQSFKSTFTGDVALQRSLGIGDTAGGGNIYSSAGALAIVPAVTGTTYGLAQGSVLGASYGAGLLTPSLGMTGTVIGGTVGATPTALGGTALVGRYLEAPIRTELRQAGIDAEAFKQSTRAGFKATGFLGDVFTGLGSKEKFLQGFEAEASARGIAPSGTARDLALRQKRSTATAELTGITLAGSSANVIGALNLQRMGLTQAGNVALRRGGAYGFRKGFLAIGGAGVVEGVPSSLSQDLARGDPLSPTRAVLAGGVGFLSAGLLGGGVVGSTLGNLPKTRRTLTGLGYVLDPSEAGSDLATGITRKTFGYRPIGLSGGRSRSRGVSVPSSPLIPTPVGSNPFVSPSPRPSPRVSPAPRPSPSPFVPTSPSVASNPLVSPSPFVPSNPLVSPSPAPQTNPFAPVSPFVPVSSKFPFGGFGAGFKRFGRGQSTGIGGQTKSRYTASFTALELGITGSKPVKKSFTGLEIRPIISPSRKPSKKRVSKRKTKKKKAKRSRK